MKATLSSPSVSSSLRRLACGAAGLSLAAACGGLHAEPASALPTASAEVASPGVGRGSPRASLEVDSRQAEPHGEDTSRWHMRYVRWASAGDAGAFGVSMGVGAKQPVAYGPYALANGRAEPTVTPEVGVRWRSGWQANRRVDVGAFQSYDNAADTPIDERKSYNARAELQFRENRSKMGFDAGSRAFGMQLSSTSKVMLRSRHGKPMVYYRSTW